MPEEKDIHERYVSDYNNIVDSLAVLLSNDSLSSFKIPPDSLKQIISVFKPGIGSQGMGDYYCERAYFLSKIDALLRYLAPDQEEKQIGFQIERE